MGISKPTALQPLFIRMNSSWEIILGVCRRWWKLCIKHEVVTYFGERLESSTTNSAGYKVERWRFGVT